MRILALDHGTKRIGIALSDELKLIAQPIEFAPAEPFSEVDQMAAAILLQSYLDSLAT